MDDSIRNNGINYINKELNYINDRFNNKDLNYLGRSFQLTGTTGSGKSCFTANLVNSEFRDIFINEDFISLGNKGVIFSLDDFYRDNLVIGVKKKDLIIDYSILLEDINKTIIGIIENFRKPDAASRYLLKLGICCDNKGESDRTKTNKVNSDNNNNSKIDIKDNRVYIGEVFKLKLKENIRSRECTVFNLLSEDFIDKNIDILYEALGDFFKEDNLRFIYNKVKNNSFKIDDRDKSSSLRRNLSLEISKILDSYTHVGQLSIMESTEYDIRKSNKINGVERFILNLNNKVDDIFFQCFSRENCSKDGYYYKVINKENKEAYYSKIRELSLKYGRDFSKTIGLFFEDIVVYTALNKEGENLLYKNGALGVINEEFIGEETIDNRNKSKDNGKKNSNKNIFSIVEKRGLFNSSLDFNKELSYFKALAYDENYDGMIFLNQMDNNRLAIEGRKVFREVLKTLKGNKAIFFINSKVDLLLDDERKVFYDRVIENYSDILNYNRDNEKLNNRTSNINSNSFYSRVKERIKNYNDSIVESFDELGEGTKNRIFYSTIYNKISKYENKEFIDEYNPVRVIDLIAMGLSERLRDDKLKENKINRGKNKKGNLFSNSLGRSFFNNEVEMDDLYNDFEVVIDEDALRKSVEEYLSLPSTSTKVIEPAKKNILENIGLMVSGESFNSFVEKLKIGTGLSTEDEYNSYTYRNISISFPGNIRNLIYLYPLKADVLKIYHRCETEIGDNNKLEEYKNYLIEVIKGKNYISERDFAVNFLYKNIFKEIEWEAPLKSNEHKLNEFLNRSYGILNDRESLTDIMVKSMIEPIKNGIKKV